MIRITAVGGEHDGLTRVPPVDMEPLELLKSMLLHGIGWEIDYSQADETERFVWGRADTVYRAIRALREGRPVRFLERIFEGLDMEVAGALEDAIADSGRMVKLTVDDATGVTIEALWPEIEQ